MKGAALIGVDVRQFMLFEPAGLSPSRSLLAWAADGKLAQLVGRTRAEAPRRRSSLRCPDGLGKTVVTVSDVDA
jgi:hypothetical protein